MWFFWNHAAKYKGSPKWYSVDDKYQRDENNQLNNKDALGWIGLRAYYEGKLRTF